jgi:UTP--glucose-1-phosphate uridylyltransferase
MVALYGETGNNIIAVQECDPAETHKYGIVGKGADVHSGFEITGMVEKPAPGTAPSNLFLNGRYILQPEIFAILEHQERGAGNEIQLTDAMLKLEREQRFYGYHYRGRTFDCGSPEGFIEANIAFALWNAEMRDRISALIDELFSEMHPAERQKAAG